MIQQKEITIYDIAEKLKISAATVSRALSGSKVVSANTRKKISDKAKEMGIGVTTLPVTCAKVLRILLEF